MLACRVRRERTRQQSAVNSHVRRQDRDVNVRKQESHGEQGLSSDLSVVSREQERL
jgi:hypothetical protein